MKRIVIFLSALILSFGAFAQVQQSETKKEASSDDLIFVDHEMNAHFPGGNKACMAWLKEHIKYPKDCLKKKIEGRVIVSFIVEKDGSLDSIKVVKSPNPSLSKEAIRVAKEMPKFVPARQGNKCIKSRFMLPINFKIPSLMAKNE